MKKLVDHLAEERLLEWPEEPAPLLELFESTRHKGHQGAEANAYLRHGEGERDVEAFLERELARGMHPAHHLFPPPELGVQEAEHDLDKLLPAPGITVPRRALLSVPEETPRFTDDASA